MTERSDRAAARMVGLLWFGPHALAPPLIPMEPSPKSENAGHREIEWQFDAVDLRPVERWLRGLAPDADPRVESPSTRELGDVYVDTDDWRLHRAGWTLRVRAREGGFEATMKSMGAMRDDRRDRREVSEPVPEFDPHALRRAPGEVGQRVRALAGPRPLRTLFEVRTRRTSFPLLL